MSRDRWQDFEADPDTGVIYWAGTDDPVQWICDRFIRYDKHFKRTITKIQAAFACYYGERVAYTCWALALDGNGRNVKKDNLIMIEKGWLKLPEHEREGIPHAPFVKNRNKAWIREGAIHTNLSPSAARKAVLLLEVDGEVVAEQQINGALQMTSKVQRSVVDLLLEGRKKLD